MGKAYHDIGKSRGGLIKRGTYAALKVAGAGLAGTLLWLTSKDPDISNVVSVASQIGAGLTWAGAVVSTYFDARRAFQYVKVNADGYVERTFPFRFLGKTKGYQFKGAPAVSPSRGLGEEDGNITLTGRIINPQTGLSSREKFTIYDAKYPTTQAETLRDML